MTTNKFALALAGFLAFTSVANANICSTVDDDINYVKVTPVDDVNFKIELCLKNGKNCVGLGPQSTYNIGELEHRELLETKKSILIATPYAGAVLYGLAQSVGVKAAVGMAGKVRGVASKISLAGRAMALLSKIGIPAATVASMTETGWHLTPMPHYANAGHIKTVIKGTEPNPYHPLSCNSYVKEPIAVWVEKLKPVLGRIPAQAKSTVINKEGFRIEIPHVKKSAVTNSGGAR